MRKTKPNLNSARALACMAYVRARARLRDRLALVMEPALTKVLAYIQDVEATVAQHSKELLALTVALSEARAKLMQMEERLAQVVRQSEASQARAQVKRQGEASQAHLLEALDYCLHNLAESHAELTEKVAQLAAVPGGPKDG